MQSNSANWASEVLPIQLKNANLYAKIGGDKTMEAYKMKVDYNKLFEKIKAEGMTQAVFKKNANINSSTLNKLLHNGNVTTEIICRICDYFQCLPEEIMEWIPDADYEDKQKAKAEVQAQIDELQEQLKKL